ncbi:hypothetical protein [Methanococcoides burtonii]|uniref:Uncharacterized protein n=1 Tax=Methanococcoides burtonii (strain DSM 6242 / NBRC 107633 / OCM 468 / ACE-M) TaxID=259564 RepID=Q12V84_METBU|nr:hypothetical protein [Methanococcoides burtonii]ABE52642.1 Hypothetical protein Mbur_1752 [Methanococcoides burtonii DSM 6242]
MGWKGTLRSINAAHRKYEREAQRRQRELERQQKQLEKMQEIERAAYEVNVYENYIDLLLSVHKECGDLWDWRIIQSSEPPIKPTKSHKNEELAQTKLDKFRSGFFDKILKRVESKRDTLTQNVEEARQADEKEYRESLQVYEQEYADWATIRELSDRILSGDTEAYLDAIKQTDPFNDISELGSSLEFKAMSNSLLEATLHVNGEDVVPSEIKSQLKSGKLSVKQMPKGKYYELYQDYICSCVLRVAREVFALLPIEMVIVNCMGNLLNSQTGYMEEKPILSVAIPRKTLEGLNFEMLDPSDSMSNFIHRMAFKKTTGFSAVESLKAFDLQTE